MLLATSHKPQHARPVTSLLSYACGQWQSFCMPKSGVHLDDGQCTTPQDQHHSAHPPPRHHPPPFHPRCWRGAEVRSWRCAALWPWPACACSARFCTKTTSLKPCSPHRSLQYSHPSCLALLRRFRTCGAGAHLWRCAAPWPRLACACSLLLSRHYTAHL